MTKNAKRVQSYKKKSLPGDEGLVVAPVKEPKPGFIPCEAIEQSDEARNPQGKRRSHDPFNEDHVAKRQAVVDSSDDSMGG